LGWSEADPITPQKRTNSNPAANPASVLYRRRIAFLLIKGLLPVVVLALGGRREKSKKTQTIFVGILQYLSKL